MNRDALSYAEAQFQRVVRERDQLRCWSWFWFAATVVSFIGFVCAFFRGYGIIHP